MSIKRAGRPVQSLAPTAVLVAVVLLASLELIPIVAAGLIGINYGSTRMGKSHQWLNDRFRLATWSWLTFDALLIFAIASISSQPSSLKFKVLAILSLLAFAYVCFYPVIVPVNLIFATVLKNDPIIRGGKARQMFPHSETLEKHAAEVLREVKQYDGNVRCIDESIPGFQVSVPEGDGCWRIVFLKLQGEIAEDTRRNFPATSRLLEHPQIRNAVFSILDPHVGIPRHTGYYKGYLRYHLGVEIPKGKTPAFIECGGMKYSWRFGEGVLFDDTYIHHVENPTDGVRVVLYIDILRNDMPALLKPLYWLSNAYIDTHIPLKLLNKAQHKTEKNEH